MINVNLIHLENSLYQNLERATEGSAGYDLKAALTQRFDGFLLEPGAIKLIETGLILEIPKGYEGQIRARSGLALKGITLANGVGTIDSDYRGEIKVALINLGSQSFLINKGDRIAQIVFAKVEEANFIEKVDITITFRGEKGFGSTGLK